jgi:hypothetical protein
MEASAKALRLATQDIEIQPTEQDDSQNPEPGTAVDDDDMQRIVKIQEFKVCIFVRVR